MLPEHVRRQEAKRRKPLPPAPAIVGRGSTFSPDVWQNAALLVDKPKGWTSFDVCAKLRGALKTKKVSIECSQQISKLSQLIAACSKSLHFKLQAPF